MVKLRFPEDDVRSDGKSFNPERPWLRQGVIGKIIIKPVEITCQDSVYNGRLYMPSNVLAVRFEGSKNYDLVSSEFLKK